MTIEDNMFRLRNATFWLGMTDNERRSREDKKLFPIEEQELDKIIEVAMRLKEQK